MRRSPVSLGLPGLAVALLAACASPWGGPARDPEPAPPVEPATRPFPADRGLTGTLWFMEETPRGPVVMQLDADGTTPAPRTSPTEPQFVGAPHPGGRGAFVVGVREVEDEHEERLGLLDAGRPMILPLAPPAGKLRNPAWSGDGAWLVVESDALSFRDLYRVELDHEGPEGGTVTRLTAAPHGSFEPDVHREDGRIVFGTSRDGNAEVYVMGPRGGAPTRLTDDPGDDMMPRWIPGTDRIAWVTSREGERRVWTMAADGTDARPLQPHPGEVLDHAWSPNGDHVAIVVARRPAGAEPHSDLLVIDRHTGLTVLTLDGPGHQRFPAWSPDGAWLAHTTTAPDGPERILRVRPDQPLQPLPASTNDRWLLRWGP